MYELAPRVAGFDATADQQLAGVLMKVGSVPLIWPVIGVLFARWARESAAPAPAPAPLPAPASPHPATMSDGLSLIVRSV